MSPILVAALLVLGTAACTHESFTAPNQPVAADPPVIPLTPPGPPAPPVPVPPPATETVWRGCGVTGGCYRVVIPLADQTGLRVEPEITYAEGFGNAGYVLELYRGAVLVFRYGYGYYWNDFLHECAQCLVSTFITLTATRGVLTLYTGPLGPPPPGSDMPPVMVFDIAVLARGDR